MPLMIRTLAVLAALLAPPLSAQEAEVPDPVAAWVADPGAILAPDGLDLDSFEYVARALVIFADSPRQPELIEQLRLIEADRRALAGRDVAIIVDADPEGASALRRGLRPRGFGLVLVDKDGGVALRQPAPTAPREVARAIDRTPIRREELAATRGR